MILKTIIVILFGLVLLSLAFGAFFLRQDDENQTRLVTALTVRIALSVLIFILLLVGYYTGQLTPHGL